MSKESADVYVVTEGVAGLYHYHVSRRSTFTQGLCGARTMMTAIPLHAWRGPFGADWYKRPTWCRACEEVYKVPAEGQQRRRGDGVVVTIVRSERRPRPHPEPWTCVVKDPGGVFTQWPAGMVATWPLVSGEG